jgi:hypothetical protein
MDHPSQLIKEDDKQNRTNKENFALHPLADFDMELDKDELLDPDVTEDDFLPPKEVAYDSDGERP